MIVVSIRELWNLRTLPCYFSATSTDPPIPDSVQLRVQSRHARRLFHFRVSTFRVSLSRFSLSLSLSLSLFLYRVSFE